MTTSRPFQPLFRRFCAVVLSITLLIGTVPLLAQPSGPRNLNADGPWLIYTATDGLIIADPDGSGRTIIAPPLPRDWTYHAAPTPTGDRLLLSTQQITYRLGQVRQASADLRLVSLPGGGTRILHQEILPPDITERTDTAALLAILADLQNPAWTPGGDGLVYANSHNGRADLYLHSLTGGISQRLTDTSAIPRQPIWSPNGRRLLWQAVDGQDRRVMMATWASASGHTSNQPPAPLAITLPYRHDWLFVGWLTPDVMIFSTISFDDPTQAQGLYRYDLQSHTLTALLPENTFLLPPAYDPVTDNLLVVSIGSGSALPPGLYRIDPVTGERTLLDNTVDVNAVDAITALTTGPSPAPFVLTTPDHNMLLHLGPVPGMSVLAPGSVFPAPLDSALAITDLTNHLTLLTEPAAAPVTVWQGTTSPPTWSADGKTIFSIVKAAADEATYELVEFPLRGGRPRTIDAQAIPGVLLLVTRQEVAIFADADLTLYAHASETSTPQATLHGDEIIIRVRGRNRVGTWLSLDLADGRNGWVPTTQVTTSSNINRLVILEN